MQEIGIGILGFGTVGAGVVEGLQKNGEMIAQRLGVRPVLRKIADLDITADRGVEVDESLLTTDAESVINDPGIDIVVELIGGTGIALKFVKDALAGGKAVVTANKKLLAEYGSELYALADANNVDLYFGASVGGGIPIIRALREGLCANRTHRIDGILNGTCNYILTNMEQGGLEFNAVLHDAQKQGFAEADPGLDIDGFDTAHKAVILSSLASGSPVSMDDVSVEGIRGMDKTDLDYALEMGYRVKLLATVKRDGDAMQVGVAPTLVPLDHLLASVNGVFNAVMVNSDLADSTMYYGRGAGRLPTASTVLGDICDIVRNIAAGAPHRMSPIPPTGETVKVTPLAETEARFYLRIVSTDSKIGRKVSDVLSAARIPVDSIAHKPNEDGSVHTLVMATGRTDAAELQAALDEISARDSVSTAPVKLRIMD